jgi:hypothetical protein
MSLCEGNWKSEIKFDQKEGAPAPEYANDGTLHICPSVNTEIRGQQTVNLNVTAKIKKTYLFQEGSCVPQGEGGRFQIEYQRDAPNEETYHYNGIGWGLNEGNGPAFIYGRVTVTSKNGAPGSGREGTWEAIRIGGHRPGFGPGEEGKGATHDGGSGGGEEANGAVNDGGTNT